MQIREHRAAELEQAVLESKKMLEQTRSALSSSESGSESENENEEWAGFEDPAPVDYEEEYIDEDKYTTVTVEEMGLSRDALHRMEENDAPSADDDKAKENAKDDTEAKAARKQNTPKKKKKKFRYESKVERKATAKKERTGARKKASARRER
jgi:ribosomal RNA-processing protein 17